MKICTKCKQEEAAKSSSWCKKCLSEYKKEHYKRNKSKYLDKAKRQRESDPDKVKAYNKKYYRDNKEAIKLKQKEYSRTEAGRQAAKKAATNYRKSEQYSLKQNARKKVLRAVKSGRLVKPITCDVCKQEKELEAHHEDYNKPLEVDWLCKECHENIHHLNEGHESI